MVLGDRLTYGVPTPVNSTHAERQRCQTWSVIGEDSVQPSRASTKLSLQYVCVCVCVCVLSGEWMGCQRRHSESHCR